MTGAGSLSPSPYPSWPSKTALSLSPGRKAYTEQGGSALSGAGPRQGWRPEE